MRRTKAPSKVSINKLVLVENNVLNKSSNDVIATNDGSLYFSVAYGKPSKKKHKTWDGDGFLRVNETMIMLLDENQKELGSSFKKQLSNLKFEEEETFYVGGKYVEILNKLDKLPQPPLNNSLLSNDNNEPVLKSAKLGSMMLKSVNSEFKPVLLNHHKKMHNSSIINAEKVIFPRPTSQHIFQHNKDCSSIRDVILDSCLSSQMRPHQIDGVKFLYECILGFRNLCGTGAILADAMGLGKSIQTIALIWTLLKQNPYNNDSVIKKCLIVCPSSLVLNWRQEFEKWLSNKLQIFCISGDTRVEHYRKLSSAPVMIMSYEMMLKTTDLIGEIKFDLLVCDEAHRLKNSKIKTSIAVESLSIPKRILLTGTPLQNDLEELFALSELCIPNIFQNNKDQFRRDYIDPISHSKEPNADQHIIEMGHQASQVLQKITQSFMLRRSDSINSKYLPPRDEYIVFCKPTQLQLYLYDIMLHCKLIQMQIQQPIMEQDSDIELNNTTESLVASNNNINALSSILLLRKICNEPHLFIRHILQKTPQSNMLNDLLSEIGRTLTFERQHNPYLNEIIDNGFTLSDDNIHSGKLYVLACMLMSLKMNEKIVVASHFTKTLDIIQHLCDHLNMPVQRIDGKTPTNLRMGIVNKFNQPIKISTPFDSYSQVMLLSCKAGGEGLNLIGANRIILFDLDWNPATDAQTTARVWRDGQKQPVSVYRLVTAGTVEESILQRQIFKQQLSSTVVDKYVNKSHQLKQGSNNFSQKELKDIFTLHLDEVTSAGSWTHHLLNCQCHCNESTNSDNVTIGTDLDLIMKNSNIRCQLGLQNNTNIEKLNADNATSAHLLDWKHLIGPNQLSSSIQDPLLMESLAQISCIFTKTMKFADKDVL